MKSDGGDLDLFNYYYVRVLFREDVVIWLFVIILN